MDFESENFLKLLVALKEKSMDYGYCSDPDTPEAYQLLAEIEEIMAQLFSMFSALKCDRPLKTKKNHTN